MLKFVVFLSESVNESRHLALIVPRYSILLLFDGRGDLSVELLFLAVNQSLQVLEHPVHLRREVLEVILGLLLAIVQLLLVVLYILLELVDLLETASDHLLLRLEGVQRLGIDAKHLGQIAHLAVVERVASVASLSILLL